MSGFKLPVTVATQEGWAGAELQDADGITLAGGTPGALQDIARALNNGTGVLAWAAPMTVPALKVSYVARPDGGVFLWCAAAGTTAADHLIGLSLEDAEQLAFDLAARVCAQRGPVFIRMMAATLDQARRRGDLGVRDDRP